MANHCRKHSLLPTSVLRALLRPSIDPRLHLDYPQCEIHILVLVSSCGRAHDSSTAVELEWTDAIWSYETIGKVTHVYIRPIGMD